MEYLKFDSLVNGTPDIETAKALKTDSFLDVLFAESVSGLSFPKNNSEELAEELNYVNKEIKKVMLDTEEVDVYKSYNASVPLHIKSYLNSVKAPKFAHSLLEELQMDINPFVLKLKYNFNRMRPYQLAPYYKLFLSPLVMTRPIPSFPSMSAIQAIVIGHVLGNRFPQIFAIMEKLAEDVCISRVRIGVNFPSDIEGSKFVSKLITNNNEFKVKYAL